MKKVGRGDRAVWEVEHGSISGWMDGWMRFGRKICGNWRMASGGSDGNRLDWPRGLDGVGLGVWQRRPEKDDGGRRDTGRSSVMREIV